MTFTYQENKYHIYTGKINHDIYIRGGKQISHLHTRKTNITLPGITFTHRENKYHIYIPGKQIMTFT